MAASGFGRILSLIDLFGEPTRLSGMCAPEPRSNPRRKPSVNVAALILVGALVLAGMASGQRDTTSSRVVPGDKGRRLAGP